MRLLTRKQHSGHDEQMHVTSCPRCHGLDVRIGFVDLVRQFTAMSCRTCANRWHQTSLADAA